MTGGRPAMSDPSLAWRNVTALPLVHGRLPFAVEARRQMLEHRFDAVAVELPPSLEGAVLDAVGRLPRISVVLYRDRPEFLDPGNRHLWYVPIDPGDGIVEALRIALGERTPIHFVDAEVEEFEAPRVLLPDAYAIRGLGLERWCEAVAPAVLAAPAAPQDGLRERHMAARLAALAAERRPDRRILFLGGLRHWWSIREHLEAGTGDLHDGAGPPPELIQVETVHPRSLAHVLGEIPHTVLRWEKHRSGTDAADYDQVDGLKDLLLAARTTYRRRHADSLEKATPQALRTILRYVRKLCLLHRRLIPDTWTLVTAAKGVVGNDFAVTLLETAHRYPPNESGAGDALRMTETAGALEDGPAELTNRAPGEPREWRHLELRRRPDKKLAARWRRGWNPYTHCSWPPEDVVIENFRAHVTRRALTLAGLSLRKTEPFTTSFKDGIALRETLRDWHRRRVHVKEEPRVAGDVGALVLVFEEDDDGTRFPWRTTWLAEHDQESTLAFYATDPRRDLVGPGIGRIHYGGCFFLFPPIPIPDVWDDLRFERARRPSERLLLSALYWTRDRFVAYAGPTPPAPEVQAQARLLGRHIVYVPLTSFSATTLERLRRAHVLNGRQVRSWADRFIS